MQHMAFTLLFSHLGSKRLSTVMLFPWQKEERQAIFTGAVFLSSTSQDEIGPRIKAELGFLYTCKRLALGQQG